MGQQHTSFSTRLSAAVRSSRNSLTQSSITSKTRSGIEMAGVFICVSVLAAVAVDVHSSSTKAASNTKAKNSQSASTDIQLTGEDTDQPSVSLSEATTSDSSVSTSVTSSTDINGQSTTDVKVNGQSIPVPQNGSSQQTVTTDGGNTSVNISTNQSTQGDANNSSRNTTNLNVRTKSTTRQTQELH